VICVEVDGSGFIVQSADLFPNCSEFALVTSAHLDRLTFWADRAIELEPSGTAFPVLVGAMITAVGVVLGLRLVVSILRPSSEEA